MRKFPRQEQVEEIDYCQTKIDDDPSSFGKFRSKFIRRLRTLRLQQSALVLIFLS